MHAKITLEYGTKLHTCSCCLTCKLEMGEMFRQVHVFQKYARKVQLNFHSFTGEAGKTGHFEVLLSAFL